MELIIIFFLRFTIFFLALMFSIIFISNSVKFYLNKINPTVFTYKINVAVNEIILIFALALWSIIYAT
jgi:hypothetical protein